MLLILKKWLLFLPIYVRIKASVLGIALAESGKDSSSALNLLPDSISLAELYSGLIPAIVISSFHFLSSSAKNLPNSSGLFTAMFAP